MTPPQRSAELTTWSVIYTLLGWLSLTAGAMGGEGEAPFFLAGGLALLPLGIGFWFRWRWARSVGLLVFAAIAVWCVWQLAHNRLWLLSIAWLLTSAETIWCLWACRAAAAGREVAGVVDDTSP